jgi:hypothetical protein
MSHFEQWRGWSRLVLLTGVLGCSDDSGPSAGNVCPQTFEFGNFGCARVAGTIRDAAGQPLPGVVVTLTAPAEADNAYDFPSATTAAAGTYALEVHRFDQPAILRAADTVPLRVRAVVPDQSELRDSMLIDVIFVPVDSVAQTVEVDLVLTSTT